MKRGCLQKQGTTGTKTKNEMREDKEKMKSQDRVQASVGEESDQS